MLPSWRDRLCISVCADTIGIVRLKRGWRLTLVDEAVITFDTFPDQPLWKAPLLALEQWLKENAARNIDADIVLSNRFARYAVVPWSADVTDRDEQQALALACFDNIYGNLGEAWEVQLDSNGEYGHPRLACAIERELIAAVKDLCKSYQLPIRSLQPYFVRACAQWRREFGANKLLLLISEPGHAMSASIKNGAWQGVRTLNIGTPTAEAWMMLANRERILQGLAADAPVYLYCPNTMRTTTAESDISLLAMPSLRDTEPHHPLDLALCGVV